MIIVASTNGRVGIEEAMRVLKTGGSRADAVEAGIRRVEANRDDHSVGFGGYPNLLGEVELDAGIMEGDSLAAGAVGAMCGYMHPISVARRVMERLPHVLLVGEGAERFAAEMGFERTRLLTGEMQEAWKEHLLGELGWDAVNHVSDRSDLWRFVGPPGGPQSSRGTVNFIVRDGCGHITAGVSTSGLSWKYPGRVGDSPIVGAGLYADDRCGAAACTGLGEVAMRACTAHAAVLYLRMGLSLDHAGRQAMLDLRDLGEAQVSPMSCIVMDREGRHAGFSNVEGRTYIYMTDEMAEPEEVARIHVA